MVAKKSNRNQKKEAKTRANLARKPKDPDKMTLQERKQAIQNTGEQLKQKITLMTESTKDNLKQIINMYTNELNAQEEKIEKYKKLLLKHNIKIV